MAINNLGFNQDFPIYNANGTPFHNLVIHQSSVESTVMSLGDKISGDVFYKDNTLTFTMGEYIVYNDVHYVLVNPPTIVRNGMVSDNGDTKGMTKYSLVFYHPMYMLGNFPFTDIAVNEGEEKYLSQNKTFSWVGNLFEFIDKLNKNLEHTDWYVSHNIQRYEDAQEEQETSQWQKASVLSDVLSFDKQFISDALKTAYDTWEIPFVIIQEENAEHKHFGIIFGLPDQEILDSNGNPFVFRFGKGVGLKNNSRTPRNNKIVTRIVGYGSERNIPYGYPQIPWYGNPDWSYTINNDPNEPNSLPIYDGILGGQSVRLIKHPFTRTTLMPSLYSEILFDKVSPYLPDGTSNTYYDPTLDLIDFYEADNTYPNPIIADAPSVEIHQFEDIYPELGEAYIVDAVPYDQDGEYYTYAQWYAYLQGRITDMQNNNIEGWQMELVQTMFNVTCPCTPEDAEEDPTAAISAGHWEWNTGQATATLDVTIKGNFVYVKLVSSWYNEEHKIVQIHADPTPVWDDTMNDNGEYIQSYFEMTLPQLSFDLYACAAITEEMKINMRGGACKGCTFPVAVDWDDYKKNFYKDDGTFDPVIHTTQGDGHVRDGSKFPDSRQGQITILVKKEIETFGTLMPNVYQQPKTGDAFVILGISLPQSYVEDAQLRLDEAMQEYMLENNVYYYDYPLTFDEHFLATHTDILAQMHNNSIVRFQYAGIEMALYIKQMNIKFGTKVLPEYEITLTDDVEIVLNKIGQVADDVSRMRVQVSELQKYYSENLIQEINSKLSRMVDDVCAGHITFQQGLDAIGSVIFHDKLQSPQFTEGLYTGRGWRIDNLGNAEFESVRVRSFLEIVELLVNRMQAQEGETIFTDNDQIEKVDTVTISSNTYYILTLKEKYQGYVTTQVEGNVIKGIMNTLAARQAGIINDQSQNPPLYFTSWMVVVETHNTPNSTLGVNQIRVSLYGDNDVPSGKNYLPCELMTIARWGSTLDPNAQDISEREKARRQRLRSTFYISTSEGHIAKLIDVHKPILDNANYGTTLGELPDFVKQYTGVASRLQDGRDYLYAQGVVVEDFIKITRQGNPIYEYVDCGAWIDGASTTPSVGYGIYLHEEFNSETGRYETHDVWHNNAKWRALMHMPTTIQGQRTYVEPNDATSAYWQKLEEGKDGADGVTYEVKWSDAISVIDSIACNANGVPKYTRGAGVDPWLTATLYKREGDATPSTFRVSEIKMHAYLANGTEVEIQGSWPRTIRNATRLALENYDSGSTTHVRYVVEFYAGINNIIATSSIVRNLDGTNADVWTIGNDGYWYKNGVKTNTKAEGTDGTGVQIKGQVANQASLPTSGVSVGDCYITNDDRHLWTCTSVSPIAWLDLGLFKGEAGDDAYMHIAYADSITMDSGGNVTAQSGFTVNKQQDEYAWIGLCTDHTEQDPGAGASTEQEKLAAAQQYEWNYVKGETGNDGADGQDMRENLIDNSESQCILDVANPQFTFDNNDLRFLTDKTFDPTKIPDNTPLSGQMRITFTNCTFASNTIVGIYLSGGTLWPYPVLAQNITANGTYDLKTENLTITGSHGTWDGKIHLQLKGCGTSGTVVVERVKIEVATKCSPWCLSENDKTARGITSVNTYFKANPTMPPQPSSNPTISGWVDNGSNLITEGNANKHLYESTCTAYTDGTYSWTTPLDDGLIADMAATEEEFGLSNSSSTQPSSSSWSSTQTPQTGKWIWSRTKLTFPNGDSKYVNVQCIGYCGTNGQSITKTSEVAVYQVTDSGTTTPSGTWYASKQAAIDAYNVAHGISGTTWQPNTFMWTRTTITWSDTTTTTLYSTDRNPNDGINGQSVTITSQSVTYSKQTIGNLDPTTLTYGTYPSSIAKGDWLYSKTTVNYSDGTHTDTYSSSYIGTDGDSGRGISTIVEQYAVNNDKNNAPSSSSFSTTFPSSWGVNNKYIWNREVITYTKGSPLTETTTPQIKAIWTKDGKGIDSIVNRYLTNNVASGITKQNYKSYNNGNEWPTTITPTTESNPYLWNFEVITYTDSTSEMTDPHVIGHFGKDGNPGRGITSVTEYYKASANATGETAPSDDSGWNTNPNNAMQGWNQTNKYLWNYEKVTYSSGTTVERSTPTVIAIWTKDGATGKGVDSITNYYKVQATQPSLPTNIDTANPTLTGWSTSPSNPPQGQYLWNFERIVWLNSDGTYSYTHTDVHSAGYTGTDGEDGQDGARGKTGRWIYYGKEFDETNTTDTFVVSDVQIPYFKTGNNIYHAFDYGVNGTYTMAQMYAIQPNFNNLPWEIMTNDFRYLITNAIFAPNATLGSFVINGDWMLSTNGVINGVAYNNGALYNGSPAYTWFDPQYPNESVNTTHSVNGQEWTGYNFVPNYAVDGLTGKTFQHDGYFDGTIKSANAEITGTVTANEGEIGPFTIGNAGLKVGDADNWKTSNNNFAYMHQSAFRIGQVERYAGHDIAWLKVLFGRESDPNVNSSQYFCDTAMYVYRRMAAAHNDYEPAIKIISDNLGNIDVAMRLKGALQVQGGGVISQGRYLQYDGTTYKINVLNLTKGTTFVINNKTTGIVYFYLPTLSEVLTQLGIASGTPFAIPISVSAHLNSHQFRICTTPDLNVFIYDNEGERPNYQTTWNYLNMYRCDVVRLILTYDGTTYYIQRAGAFT